MKRELAALAALALVAPPALGSYGEHLASVHFNSARPDFGIVPRRGLLWIDEYDDRPEAECYGGSIDHQELSADRDAEREANRRRAVNEGDYAAGRGDWARARTVWRAVEARFGIDAGLRDRLEIAAHGSLPPAAARYIGALHTLEGPNRDWNPAGRTLDALEADTKLPSWLREHSLYQRACLWRQWLVHERETRLWQEQLRRFPGGEKREAALLMIARSGLLGSEVPIGPATGQAAAEQLLRSFPHSRFRDAARGLLARVDLERGALNRAAEAYCTIGDGDSILKVRARNGDPHLEKRLRTLQLIAYLRDFARARTYEAYRRAGQGIGRSLALMKPDTGRAFLKRLVGEPDLAAPYLYYRLYHCSNTPGDIARLGQLAERIAGRHGAESLAPLLRVRFAEVAYRQRRWRSAVAWADTALRDPDPVVRARALYVRAASRHKRGQLTAARGDLETLLEECPNSPLEHGACELLALCAEAQRDWTRALELYTTLDYQDDRAYLVDVRMPLATLEEYWRTHSRDRDLLAFSIGIRHMREERWREARRWLGRVSQSAYHRWVSRGSYPDDWQAEFIRSPKRTLESLAYLDLRARQARGRAARASARYAYAREYYTAGLLQLYNPPLWRFNRMFLFDIWWNPEVTARADRLSVRRYMYRHEVYAHARRICLDIARQYPETPTAPYALYRAACAAERLAGFNDWWDSTPYQKPLSGEGPAFDHRLEGIHLFRRLVRRYPKHPLAPSARKYAAVYAGGEFAE